jgi:hypothetical protein
MQLISPGQYLKKIFSQNTKRYLNREVRQADLSVNQTGWYSCIMDCLDMNIQTYLLETIPLGKIVCSIGQDCLTIINEIVQEDI